MKIVCMLSVAASCIGAAKAFALRSKRVQEKDQQAEPVPDDGQQQVEEEHSKWWEFGLHDPVQDNIALFYLGHAYDGSSDVGEVLETMGRIKRNVNATSWKDAWISTAERLEDHAAERETKGMVALPAVY